MLVPRRSRVPDQGSPVSASAGSRRAGASRLYNRVHVKLRDLAARLGCRLEGDGDLDIVRVAGIHDAGPGDLTFVANPKYEKALPATRASAAILRTGGPAAPCAVLRTDDPYLTFARAVALFAPDDRPAAGVHPLTAIAPDARLGAGVVDRPVRRRGRRRVDWRPHRGVSQRDHRPGRAHRRRLRRPRQRVDPRARGGGAPRRAAGRCGPRRRRLRLRAPRRRHAREDPAGGGGRDRGRRRDRRQHHGGSPGGGRDADQGRARRSTTWCRWGTASRSAATRSWRPRWASRAAPASATTSSSAGRSASAGT